jgi:hypothetical protein
MQFIRMATKDDAGPGEQLHSQDAKAVAWNVEELAWSTMKPVLLLCLSHIPGKNNALPGIALCPIRDRFGASPRVPYNRRPEHFAGSVDHL